MLHFANSDSTIWNKDQFIIDLIQLMQAEPKQIDISTNGEGPCAQSLGLYDLLDILCERFCYPRTQINLHTCNLIEQHDYYNVVRTPQMIYLDSAKKFAGKIDHTKKFDDDFRTFGHFIGHGNLPRLRIASYLFDACRESTHQTYHFQTDQDYHKPFIALDALLQSQHGWQELGRAISLLNHAPLKIDEIDHYPILNPATLNITKIYPSFFVEIVSLTYFSGNTFYIDEKIWRPIIMRTPFMVQGPQNFIKNLRHLGFRTFEKYWDEGYSEDPEDCQVSAIINNIGYLSALSSGEIEKMYDEMIPDLEYNFELFKSLDQKKFLDF